VNTENAERTEKGNKSYYVNVKLIKSKFLNKYTKMNIHETIRPVVTYSSGTWTVTAENEKNLRILKGKY
jgi:hypothetical protein